MERMWRKVNQGLSGRSSKTTTIVQSTDTASSAGFGDPQIVVAVAGTNNLPPSTATGRRLASSGQNLPNSFSQHILHNSTTASSERKRRRRRKSRPRPRIEKLYDTSRINESLNQQQPAKHTKSSTSMSANNGAGGTATGGGDPTLRQRAVAKLRMFNFHLNWDLHMTQCKPCGPRSSGNIITRRLCRNRRRDDNELYRSNSFKFERFERKEISDGFSDTLTKQISICDDYSLPVDFVKKRPSSFDPGLADKIPENWTAPSPLSDHVTFINPSTVSTKPPETIHHHHPPLPNTSRQAPVNLIEGYSDPKDSKRTTKVHHRKHRRDKRPVVIVRNNYHSDSSAPKSSSADEIYLTKNVPELNSPDSISEDLIRPLPPFHKSPKKFPGLPDTSKRNPSPYYYSDLLKTKINEKETTNKSRHSTASEPPQLTQSSINIETYRKSTSLDVPEVEHEEDHLESQSNQLNTELQLTPKRYSITEDGVRIIRCNTPSTTTSDDSDCSECQKRREWHANALALVRQTCNIQNVEKTPLVAINQIKEEISLSGVDSNPSMPPRRLLGPVVCACTTPALGDDVDEYFRPRSIFYVHALGEHECADCSPSTQSLNKTENSNDQLPTTDLVSKKNQDMSSSRTRQIYETAFDCKIAKSDDDLDEVNRLTNSTVLLQIENGNVNVKAERSKPNKSRLEGKRLKNSKNQAIQEKKTINIDIGNSSSSITGTANSITALSNNLENVHIDNNIDQMNNATSTSQLPMRGYTPSPPSTAPLPIKFPGKHDRFFMNSIKSAPNLPSSNPAHPRLKDLRLPIQSAFRHHHQQQLSNAPKCSNESSTIETNPTQLPSRTRNRPRSVVLESGRVLELRKSHHHHVGHHSNQSGSNNAKKHNYSSTESMATSSSGGSMESLRSSTSEGNRSTTSSESRHSTSLSSHSSESGTSVAFPLRAPVVLNSKLHILSPISDKSSLEPASDASDLNKKPSPDTGLKPNNDISTNESAFRPVRRRPPPNKTLLHLTDEILGSDSGISLHSREDPKSSVLHKFTLPNLNFSSETAHAAERSEAGNSSIINMPLPQDLHDLPFDMPKLRRRKVLLQQNACTSGSATSVDLGDLPFDMPKLRRRLRMNQNEMNKLIVHSTESSGMSQASSSHSVRDDIKQTGPDAIAFRRNLTLNFNEVKQTTDKFSSLDLRGLSSSKQLNLNLNMSKSAVELIDITVPMERQGWYHGSITRLEAESTLRPLSEGCFLVRNCESTKQDYSLSLKGAKGFMHMRIQRNNSNQYVLGQFSRPFDSVPEMIRHFCLNRLPVRGAEHMCLIEPVIAPLL